MVAAVFTAFVFTLSSCVLPGSESETAHSPAKSANRIYAAALMWDASHPDPTDKIMDDFRGAVAEIYSVVSTFSDNKITAGEVLGLARPILENYLDLEPEFIKLMELAFENELQASTEIPARFETPILLYIEIIRLLNERLQG